MRHACRTDRNQSDVIELLRANGYQVWVMKPPCPFDLLCWRKGGPRFVALEVKTKTGRLTDNQIEFFAATEGQARAVVSSPDAALEAAQAWC